AHGEGHLVHARLAQIEDVDAGVVGHSAAVLREVGLAIVVDVVASGDGIVARLRHRHAESHRSGPCGNLNAVYPAARGQPVLPGRAVNLHSHGSRTGFHLVQGDAHSGAAATTLAHVVGDLVTILRVRRSRDGESQRG